MVKVLKERHKHEEKHIKCFCWNCESLLEYKKEDRKTWLMFFMFGAKYIKCPVCGKKLMVD